MYIYEGPAVCACYLARLVSFYYLKGKPKTTAIFYFARAMENSTNVIILI